MLKMLSKFYFHEHDNISNILSKSLGLLMQYSVTGELIIKKLLKAVGKKTKRKEKRKENKILVQNFLSQYP